MLIYTLVHDIPDVFMPNTPSALSQAVLPTLSKLFRPVPV
jgi:hypothetical protein